MGVNSPSLDKQHVFSACNSLSAASTGAFQTKHPSGPAHKAIRTTSSNEASLHACDSP